MEKKTIFIHSKIQNIRIRQNIISSIFDNSNRHIEYGKNHSQNQKSKMGAFWIIYHNQKRYHENIETISKE